MMKDRLDKRLDMIRGSLIGGAAGDALGYEIEFDGERHIFEKYGKNGIENYVLHGGKALISDDTQMTLFTANGILFGATRMALRGIGANPSCYVADCYDDWLKTQETSYGRNYQDGHPAYDCGVSWLLHVPELYSLRAPGNTCLSAIRTLRHKPCYGDYVKNHINHSKGCGGIMRVAPLALHYTIAEGGNIQKQLENLDLEAAEIAAITHGHSLGYMPAAVVSHIISRIMLSKGEMSLKCMVLEARDTVERLYKKDKHINELVELINLAVELAEDKDEGNDLDNIHKLGEGWVAEETMAIAIYCALKYQNDFSKALTVSVNHRGDSDSTGAVTGNILGAWIGYEAIDEKWKENLELKDVILEMAEDLSEGCKMSEGGSYYDPDWMRKYGA